MSKDYIKFSSPQIGEDEIEEVVKCLRGGWLTTGPLVKKFEDAFSKWVGRKYCCAVNSATAGLHLALEAVGVSEGDKVVTTPYTFTATAEVVRYLGADPVFVDIDKDTFNIDLDRVDDYLAKEGKCKAIIPVHFAGQACDVSRLTELTAKYNLKQIDDAAHALPATSHGKLVGVQGDACVYSFYANKTITTGEGGMIVTDNKKIADRVKIMRLHGISRDVFDRYSSTAPSWYYEVVAPGYKYNMTDMAAALGIHQLKKAEKFRERREQIADIYTRELRELPLKCPFVKKLEDKHSWHLYVIQLKLEELVIGRDEFIQKMSEAGVGASVHFIPLHLQPYWRDRYGFQPDDFPVSYDVYKRAVSLPIYPSMTDDQVVKVVEVVKKILQQSIKFR